MCGLVLNGIVVAIAVSARVVGRSAVTMVGRCFLRVEAVNDAVCTTRA